MIMYAQEEPDKFRFEVGYIAHFNYLNQIDYIESGLEETLNTDYLMGLNLLLKYPIKKINLDLMAGVLFEGSSVSSSNSESATGIESHQSYMNGGGVYTGISKGIGNEYIGITFDIAIAYFTYKDVRIYYNSRIDPTVELNDSRYLGGFGALSSLGFYLRYKWIGINPKLNVTFSGDSASSLLLYGFILPIEFSTK